MVTCDDCGRESATIKSYAVPTDGPGATMQLCDECAGITDEDRQHIKAKQRVMAIQDDLAHAGMWSASWYWDGQWHLVACGDGALLRDRVSQVAYPPGLAINWLPPAAENVN